MFNNIYSKSIINLLFLGTLYKAVLAYYFLGVKHSLTRPINHSNISQIIFSLVISIKLIILKISVQCWLLSESNLCQRNPDFASSAKTLSSTTTTQTPKSIQTQTGIPTQTLIQTATSTPTPTSSS